ncbi:maternal protein tudor-like isoform X2 [Macrosteles quadrilineatus]|uniref:maternal protein tudor-like isoform X2 n=1 Tax=Macrosteles quadrilineatus TaxID=74068 RepID=UPI0023E23DA6|nr:maternal protein tudor-like isoform X2 [Macrosteles quadrilineatus]
MAEHATPRDIHITYVDTDGPLIKIFAQIDKGNPEYIERLLYQLKDVLESTDLKPRTLNDIKEGLICCAKFTDGAYYRARIEHIDTQSLSLLVFFIDHGNVAQVDVADVRLLEKLQSVLGQDKIVQFLKGVVGLAEEFYLAGVAPKRNHQWDESTIESLRKELCNSDLKGVIHEVGEKKIVNFGLGLSVRDPAKMIIESGKGVPLPLHHLVEYVKLKKCPTANNPKVQAPLPQHINTSLPPPKLPPAVGLQHVPQARLPNLSHPPPARLPNDLNPRNAVIRPSGVHVRPGVPGMQLRRPEASISIPAANLQFSTEMLNPGVTHRVYVSHVEDGPHSFAVQLQNVVDEVLTRMMLDLNNIEPQPITTPLNPGSICVGRYAEDKTLCRAIVMNVMDDKLKLYFADFGTSEIVSFSEVYQIPQQFVAPKVMSHRFTLANIKDITYTEEEKMMFKNLVANARDLTMTVTPPEANPLKQYCELFLHCKNIKTIMAELSQSQHFYLRYSPVSSPLKGSQEKVFVSYVVNPGRFYVQLDKNDYSLNQVMKYVADHCSRAPHVPLSNQRPGEPCCALFSDGIWYRAEIIRLTTDNKAFINFVDFGNEEEIEITNLRQISPELVKSLKAQAILCSLIGYENRYNVAEEISNRLEELILEQQVMMHVQDTVEMPGQLSKLIVRLINTEGTDINNELEMNQAPAPVQNSYQAPAPAKPTHTAQNNHADGGWEDTSAATTQNNSWGQSESHGQSEEKKQWRSREGGEAESRFNKDNGRRFNRDDESKPFNRDDNRSGRFSRDSDSKGDARFNRDSDSRGGKFNEERGNKYNKSDDEKSTWRKKDDDSGGWKPRGDRESGGGWKPREEGSGGGWKSREEGGGGGWKPKEGGGGGWKSREEGGGGGWKSREEGGGGGWKSKEEGSGGGGWKPREEGGGGGWKSREGGGGGWKPREEGGGGGWKSREDGGGDRRNRFDGERRGGFNKDSGDRSSFRKPWDKAGGDRSGGTKSPKPDTVGGMPHSTVKVGQTDKVEVCFTTSPLDFYVQLSNTFEELTQLMDKIATGCDSGDISDTTDVQEKSGCLAKYSEDDSWYRAVVLEKSFDSVKVLFVDYGNEENVSTDKIKTLPEDMITLPVQAIKCRLLGVPETAETEPFKALAEGKPLKTQFVSRNFITKSFEVVLVDEETNTNINVAMGASEDSVQSSLSKMGSLTQTTLNYPAGSVITSQLTWYLSPSQLYLQPMDSNPEFRAMMQAMQAIVRTGTVKQNTDLNVGDFVIARFKADKVLYRALVQESGFVPKVQYVDYGNVEVVDSGSVWAMETEFAYLPIQAVSCCLAGVQPTGEAWPAPNSTALDSYFEADTFDCTVVKELEGENNIQYLVKLVKQGEDVAQKIIEAGLAVGGSNAVGVASELDTNLIVGQALPVTLLKVQEDYTVYVQPASEDGELQSLEFQPGQGVKCVLSNVKETATDEQRQAFTQLPADTYVIMLVDAVQSEGLQVTLFDGEGQLLDLQENEVQSVEKVCPMPILNMHQKVWIAHASEDGIFLHKIAYADLLADLLQKLYEFYNDSEPVEQEWNNGNLCCAKSVADEQWYRAKILETGEETKVQYVDYGNTEVIPSSHLRQLDASFYTPHALALPVSLHVTWSVPVETLMELAGETEYNAVILRNKTGWIVELVDSSGQSLTEKLVELGFVVALDNSPFKRVVEGGRFAEGSDIPISVSFIDSPLQLWIHVGDDIELIEALQDRLQDAAPKLLPLREATGMFAAKFSDGQWYRALKLDDTSARFVDYGNSDVVDMSDIKALSPDFLEPAEGYAVKLELPIEEFKEGANEKLEELLISSEISSEEEVIAHILSVKENSIVADIKKGGKSIVDILVEEKLATKKAKVFSGFVSNINSLNDFFVQEVGCEESLEMIVNALTAAETFETVSEVNENDLVAALFTDDGSWYRAKVTKKSENGIEVLFIDYGNSSISTEFRTLPPELAEKTALAKHCALQLPEGVEEWTESALEKFMEISAEGCTQFDLKLITEGDPAIVVLHSNDKCVNEELKPFCDSNAPVTAKTESASPDLTGYDKVVYISHINGPNDFYIQVDGAETELDTLRDELTDVSSFETLENITDDMKNQIFGALFVDDESWYRAKLLNISEEGTKVLFVDYGNSAITSQFVKLPEKFLEKEPVALHCTFGGKHWSEEANNCFVELGGEGTVPFSMKVLKDSDPMLVSLASENMIVEQKLSTFINDTLLNSEETSEEPTSKLSSSEPAETIADESIIKTVFLIHVNSPNDFFLHTAEATQLLTVIDERLVAAEEFPLLGNDSISKGKIVAAQFDEDDLWYRAKIIDHSENEIKVTFIDYGNSVKVAKLKELPDDLLKIPALAMNCALVKPGDGEWDVVTSDMFNKLANEDGVSFELKIISDGEPNLVSLYTNGESVAEQLIVASSMSQVDDSNVTGRNAEENNQDLQKEAKMQDMIMESVDNKIENIKLEEDMKQIVEDSLANALSSNLGESSIETEQEVDSAESSPVKNDENNKILEDQFVSEVVEGSKHEAEIQDMIMESVDAKIENMQLQEDMQQIVEDSLKNALSSNLDESSVVTEQEVDSAESSPVKNDENKILEDHSVSEVVEESKHAAEMQDMIMESVDAKIENMKLQEDMQHVDNFETEKEVASAESLIKNIDNNNIQGVDQFVSEVIKESKHVTLDTSSSNGVSNVQEDEDKSMKNPETSDSVNEAESKSKHDSAKTDTSGSPTTPRRYNVDDHIVPGCISSAIPEGSSDK